MGCGCGGLPPSITLRIEAARIAVSAGVKGPEDFKTLAGAAFEFLTDGTDVAGLDSRNKRSGQSVGERNAFLNAPLAVMRMVREATIDKLELAGVMQPGALVQWSREQVVEHASLTEREAHTLAAELEGRGLRFGMTGNELRAWIKGNEHGDEEAGQ